jgi:hypothetical protein
MDEARRIASNIAKFPAYLAAKTDEFYHLSGLLFAWLKVRSE